MSDKTSDLRLWERAKGIAHDKGEPTNWVLVADIYHYLGGKYKSLYLYYGDKKFFIVGYYDKDRVLAIHKGGYTLLSASESKLSKKEFKDVYDKAPESHRVVKPSLTKEGEYSGYAFSKNKAIDLIF